MPDDYGLARAQAQYDAMQPPEYYEAVPEPTNAEIYAKLWDVMTTAMHTSQLNACCETLSKPATMIVWTSVDVSLGFVVGCEAEFFAALRAAADAGEKWAAEH